MKKGLLYTVAALLLLTSVVSAVTATNWTMYGFDEANTGFSPDFAPSSMNKYLDVQLTTSTGTLTGAAAVNDILYVGSSDGNIFAVDNNNGEIIWQQTVGSVGGTPAVMSGRVYIGNSDSSGDLYCYAADDGEFLWQFPSGRIHYAPTGSNGRIYFGDQDGKVYCINSNGGEIWQYNTGGLLKSTPALYDNKVYVSANSAVYCLDKMTGDEIWQYTHDSLIKEGAPAISGDKVYVSANEEGELLCLDAQGNGDGSTDLLWSYTAPGNNVNGITSPALAYGNVYFGLYDFDHDNDDLICLDQETGQEVWTHEFAETISFSITATPVIASEKLYIGTAWDFDDPMFVDFFVYCVDAIGNGDGTTNVLWQYQQDKRIINSGCIFDGHVVIGGRDNTLLGFYTPTAPTLEGPDQGYVNERLEFTAQVDAFAQSGQVQYMFDWGDGEDTYWLPDEDGIDVGEPFTLEYKYDLPGDYEVRVKARDPVTETESEWVSHMVHITPIRITAVSGGFGVNIQVRNDGVLAKDLHWEVDLIGGQLPGFHLKRHFEGDVIPLEANATTLISTPMVFGLGDFDINIKLEYAGEPTLEETVEGTILFFYVLV